MSENAPLFVVGVPPVPQNASSMSANAPSTSLAGVIDPAKRGIGGAN